MQSLSDYPEKLNSLGEVQRIIGLSLSKIQLGRNQRGGLPLHKNLLVATVLNKARDLYMQETMYMNYKMMTGHQFGMVTASGSDLTASGSTGFSGAGRPGEEEMDDPPENEEYDEDSESDVEDESETRSCELAASSRSALAASMAYPASTMAAMMMQAAAASVAASSSGETGLLTPIHPSAIAMQKSLMLSHHGDDGREDQAGQLEGSFSMHGSFQHLQHLSQLHHQHQQQQEQQQQQQQQHQHAMAAVQAQAAAAVAAAVANQQQQHQQQQQQQHQQQQVSGNDEGFIDCDCDVRNFSTMDTRVPFQFCYNCAPFQSANGRGPTLVPSPSACPALPAGHDDESIASTSTSSSSSSSSQASQESNFTIYDMDSKSTERKSPCDEPSSQRHGTKRRRKGSDADGDDANKKRRSSEKDFVDVVNSDDSSKSLKSGADQVRMFVHISL